MAEVASSSKVAQPKKNDPIAEKPSKVIVIPTTPQQKQVIDKLVETPLEKPVSDDARLDIFTSAVDREKAKSESPHFTEQKEWQDKLVRQSEEMTDTIKKADETKFKNIKAHVEQIQQQALTKSNTFVSAVNTAVTSPVARLQDAFEAKTAPIFDITEKLAAIYGEKEKDIKDRLSDTFKKLFPKEFNPLDAIDASMEQKEHGMGRKLKEQEEQPRRPEEEDSENEKSMFKRINYRLLKTVRDLLDFTEHVTAAFIRKKRAIEGFIYGRFKSVKEEIVENLDRIDAILQSKVIETQETAGNMTEENSEKYK